MTNEEMDRAIADFCGWEDCANGFGTETRYKGTPSEVRVTVPYPRYSTDLNAMHEAEHSLKYESSTWDNYCKNLIRVCSGGHPFRENNIVAATARHRAEAFLRTIGKYHATHPLP